MVGLGPCVGKEGVVSIDLKIENSLLQEFSRKKLIKENYERENFIVHRKKVK